MAGARPLAALLSPTRNGHLALIPPHLRRCVNGSPGRARRRKHRKTRSSSMRSFLPTRTASWSSCDTPPRPLGLPNQPTSQPNQAYLQQLVPQDRGPRHLHPGHPRPNSRSEFFFLGSRLVFLFFNSPCPFVVRHLSFMHRTLSPLLSLALLYITTVMCRFCIHTSAVHSSGVFYLNLHSS